jgi:PAS domain S-box-containing protein
MTSDQENRRILLIDDNPSIHEDFKKILLATADDDALNTSRADLFGSTAAAPSMNCFSIQSAFQGQEGLERVREALAAGRPLAMAFVDVRMPPGWDGIETLAEIWKVDPDLQAVICTAYSDYTLEEVVARLGQTDRFVILKKPFDNVEVLQLANALTKKWRLLQQSKEQVKGLRRDVTLRTIELRRTEQRFRVIAENAAELITLVDADGRCHYLSPSWQRALGCTVAEVQGTDVYAQIHPEDRERVKGAARECFATGKDRVIEFRLQSRDGLCRVFESHVSVIRQADGQSDQLLIVARDVSERKEAERQRQQMEIQLRHAQKLESIGQLAAGIAHEINTPTQYVGDNTRFLKDAFGELNKVQARQQELLQTAKAGPVPAELIERVEQTIKAADLDYLMEEIPKSIQQSLDGVERVAKIVRAMKEFSHPGTSEKSAIDLNRSIESTVTVCRNEWKYVAELVTEFDPALPPVECLPGEINQTVLNIVVNAAHAIADVVGDGTRGKGKITVSTRRDGDWAEIRIGDTGTGIPEEARARVFDPFFTTKGVGKGTGQGLAIAHSVIVDKHGGTITFETESGKGTTFVIRIPIRAASRKDRKAA